MKRLFNMIDIMCDNDYVMVKLQCGNQELSTVTAAPYSRLKRRRPPLRHLRSFLSNTFQHHSCWRHSTLIMFHLDGVCAPVTAASNHKSVSDASYRRRPPGEKLRSCIIIQDHLLGSTMMGSSSILGLPGLPSGIQRTRRPFLWKPPAMKSPSSAPR